MQNNEVILLLLEHKIVFWYAIILNRKVGDLAIQIMHGVSAIAI